MRIKPKLIIKAIIPLVIIMLSVPIHGESISEQGSMRSEETKASLASSFYEIGIKYYREGRYKEALDAFDNVSQIYPHFRDLDYYSMVTQESLSQEEGRGWVVEEAAPVERKVEKVEKEEKEDQDVARLYAQGCNDMQRGLYEEAVMKFQDILRLNPAHKQAWHNLIEASSRVEKKKEEDARGSQDLIKESIRKRLKKVYLQGRTLLTLDRPEEALKKFEEVYEADPEYKDAQQWLIKTRLLLLVKEREVNGSPYTLGPEDVIEVNVQNHPELSGSVTIEFGGEMIVPLVKEVIDINDLTLQEAETKIRTALSKYVKDPEVKVVITGYNSKKWYILGEVGFQGEFPMGGKRITLMEALYRAGLPRDGFAATKRVVLIKPSKTKPYVRSIDVDNILYYGKMKDNTFIEPGDIIYVPKTIWTKFTQQVGLTTSPMNVARFGMEDLLSFEAATKGFRTEDFTQPRKFRRRSYLGAGVVDGRPNVPTGNQ